MKYPKKKETFFHDAGEFDCVQINVHYGRKWNYWFIEPAEKPLKLAKNELPSILR